MKAAIVISVILFATMPALAGIGEARRLLKQGDAREAGEVLADMLKETPNDPWLLYNMGVTAYAAKDYARAESLWQQLAGMELPEELVEQVWMQLGNASFRQAEGSSEQQPAFALSKIEQSREAYRIAISQNPEGEVAQKNLDFVEKQLEQLHARLAARLVADARDEKAPERAIEKLYAALEHQRSATALNPQEPQYAEAEREIVQLLAEKFVEKAADEEKQGDRIADQKSLDPEKLKAARQEYEKAIADFKQARVFKAEMPEAEKGEKRVTEKLADMFAKAGRQEQRKGNAQAKKDAAEALESYETALDHFDEALAVKKDHGDALEGQKEVKQAMEKLHIQEGDRMTKAGERELKKDPGEAVGNLLGALDHFEQAKAINPDNPEIPPKIEYVKKLLPDALVAMGKSDQLRAEEAEPTSVEKAIAHLENAEAAYEKALQLAPGHEEAEKGLKEVREDLERLRKKLDQEQPPPPPPPASTQQQQQQQPTESQQKQQQEKMSFEEMLAQVKAKQEKREINAKGSAGAKYDPANALWLKNW